MVNDYGSVSSRNGKNVLARFGTQRIRDEESRADFKKPFATNARVSSTNQIRSSPCSAQLNWHLTDPSECFGK